MSHHTISDAEAIAQMWTLLFCGPDTRLRDYWRSTLPDQSPNILWESLSAFLEMEPGIYTPERWVASAKEFLRSGEPPCAKWQRPLDALLPLLAAERLGAGA